MKWYWIVLLSLCTIQACTMPKSAAEANSSALTVDNIEGEYDIIVFDSQYAYFLNAIAYPQDFYTEAYYKNKNIFLVNEWNYRHSQPMRFDPDIYEVSIDYNPSTAYGKSFEYKLYNFFKFMEWKHGVDLDGRAN